MNTETEVRSRRLDALLEEAVQGGPSGDLARRIAARLDGEPVRRGQAFSTMAAAMVLVGVGVVAATVWLRSEPSSFGSSSFGSSSFGSSQFGGAQDLQGRPTVRLVVRSNEVAGDGKDPATGRWSVGAIVCADLAQLRRGLASYAKPVKVAASGEQGQRLLEVAPTKDVPWIDVVAATECALGVGFLDMRYQRVPECRISWRAVELPKQAAEEERVLKGPSLVATGYASPLDLVASTHVVLDVFGDGRVAIAGEVLVGAAGAKEKGVDSLRQRLLERAANLREDGELTLAGGRKVVATPLLLRVDRKASWHRVRQVLDAALDPAVGFYRVDFAFAAASGKRK